MTLRIDDIRFLQDAINIRRFPWLSSGSRVVYYDDIEDIEIVSSNSRNKGAITLRLKNKKALKLSLSSMQHAEIFKTELEEIIRPQVIRDEKPLAFNRIATVCDELAASQGQNIRKIADFIMSQGICHLASDIYMEYSKNRFYIYFKIDGVLFPVVDLVPAVGERLANCIMVAAGMILYRRDTFQEGRITQPIKEGFHDLRVSVIPSEPGERITIRMFDKLKGLSGLEDLGFSPEILTKLKQIAALPQGLFIICGPSGSGKTTTIYAFLRHLKAVRGHMASIITLEDPVEYRLEGITQIRIDLKGKLTFSKALKSALRQDPGVLVIGEIRDAESADAAIRAALTGHLVLSTLHCGSTAEAITRLLDLGIRPFLLNSALSGVLCQRIVRKVCPDCLEVVNRSSDELSFWDKGIVPSSYVKGSGCELCRQTGYLGRTVIAEYLEKNTKITALVNNNSETKAIEKAAVEQGMTLLHESGLKMVTDRITDPEEIKRVVG